MENNIPTSEEFLIDLDCHSHLDDGHDKVYYEYGVHKAMIEFAKLHLTAQAETIFKLVQEKLYKVYGVGLDQNSITNAYDLNQIK
jgi:hypothetical protein